MMTLVVVILALVVVFMLFVRPGFAPTALATVADIPGVVDQLATLKNGSFAAFMFDSPLSPGGDPVNLQYSVEQRAVGIDWVLLSKTNIADKDKISALAARMGHPMTERVMNNVHYLRAEGRDLDKVGMSIILDFYGIPRNQTIELLTEGFKWPPQT